MGDDVLEIGPGWVSRPTVCLPGSFAHCHRGRSQYASAAATATAIARLQSPGGELAGCDSLPSAVMRLVDVGEIFIPVGPDSFPSWLKAAAFEAIEVGGIKKQA